MLWIKVDFTPGNTIHDVVARMELLARRLGVGIEAELNGVAVLATPGDDPGDIVETHRRKMAVEAERVSRGDGMKRRRLRAAIAVVDRFSADELERAGLGFLDSLVREAKIVADRCRRCGGKGFTVEHIHEAGPRNYECVICGPMRNLLAKLEGTTNAISQEAGDH